MVQVEVTVAMGFTMRVICMVATHEGSTLPRGSEGRGECYVVADDLRGAVKGAGMNKVWGCGLFSRGCGWG